MKRLKQLRKKKGITQNEFAKTFKVAQNTVSNWESGSIEPCYETILEIAEYFGVTSEYLMGYSDDERKGIIEETIEEWKELFY